MSTPAKVTMRLAQGDTSALIGPYDCEINVVDNSELAPADAIKHAETGVVVFLRSGDGDVDVP